MSIFGGLDAIIDSSLGIDETWVSNRGSQLNHGHKETLLRLCGGPNRDVDGQKLVRNLLNQVNQNWGQTHVAQGRIAPSPHNWRRRMNTDLDPANTSDEVTLERTITQVTDGNWWNQIPVEEALLGITRGRVVDLVHRDGVGGRDFEIIELKTGSPYTPLSAAGQVLKYGIVYAFFRSRYEEIFLEEGRPELMNAALLKLIVLAPWDFYQEFAKCRWLAEFETSLQQALQDILNTPSPNLLEMGFQFQSFPKTFTWLADMANDEQARKEVLWAVHHRIPVFPP